MRRLDLARQVFGKLIVVRAADKHNGLSAWECTCQCGNTAIVSTKYLRNGGTRSCGCLHIAASLQKVYSRARPVGFERITSKGYVEIKTENGFRRKHVHIMEKALGRRLTADEVVHHIDEDKQNNALENLQLMTHAQHTIHHNIKGNRHA